MMRRVSCSLPFPLRQKPHVEQNANSVSFFDTAVNGRQLAGRIFQLAPGLCLRQDGTERKTSVPTAAEATKLSSLYDADGHRRYLTPSEREAFLKAADEADRHVRTFCHVLAYTGCRISEALAAASFLKRSKNGGVTFTGDPRAARAAGHAQHGPRHPRPRSARPDRGKNVLV
jgi:hypothetical protein